MQKIIILLIIVGFLANGVHFSYSQDASLATFQETAQVLIDKRTQEITSSITLQSTSIQEIKIPSELEEKIRNNPRITSVIITNEDQCILGVFDQSCIIINVSRDPTDKGVIEIQDSTKELANQFIDDINQAFDTKSKFHSVFIHSDDELNRALETSGAVSGRGIVSAVYTMPMEDSDSMYEKISAILIPKIIRDGNGFYETAKNLSSEDNSKVTFSIIPLGNNSLLQLKLSTTFSEGSEITKIEPLKFLSTNELKRSEYFSSGFYPLNSIFQIVILANEPLAISNVSGDLIPTQIIDGEKIPKEFTKGWVFDPDGGEKIQGKFIFGRDSSITNKDLEFSLADSSQQKQESSFDESIVILVIIIVGGIGAAVYFLKGYKK